MIGGEIYVKKIPSMNIMDIARAAAPKANCKIVGIRPGEKLHEQMISREDAPYTYEYQGFYKILPAIFDWSSDPNRIGSGVKVAEDFSYESNTNPDFMSVSELKDWIDTNKASLRSNSS